MQTYCTQKFNGHVYDLSDEYLYVDGIGYKLPKKSTTYCIATINDKVYVNGYEFKNGKFKKTFKSIWYKLF